MNKIGDFQKEDYAPTELDWKQESAAAKDNSSDLPYNALRVGMKYKRSVRETHEKL
jgi:hypothetical protein